MAAVFLLFSCAGRQEVRFSGRTMGTTYHITIVSGWFKQPFGLHKKIQTRLAGINHSMSTYQPDSDISRFNRQRQIDVPTAVSADFFEVMTVAQKLYSLTDGAWDGTVKPLVDLWGFGTTARIKVPPSAEAVASQLSQVGFDRIVVNDDRTIVKRHPAVVLDLASIAKGYAVDALARLIRKNGFTDYLVEIGGEVYAAGRRIDGTAWRVGINRPTAEAGSNDVYRIVGLSDRAMATSGDYRNFFEADGIRYSHVIDPRNGYPVANRVISVTVMARDCAFADGLATAVMVMGAEAGLGLIENLEGVEALIMLEAKAGGVDAHLSAGFARFLQSVN